MCDTAQVSQLLFGGVEDAGCSPHLPPLQDEAFFFVLLSTFVYLTSQLRHSLMVKPLLKKSWFRSCEDV